MGSLTESVYKRNADHWSSQSWQSKAINAQTVDYRDKSALDKVCRSLQQLPPIVSPAQIEEPRGLFASAAKGERFILQVGDCAESFEDVQLDITNSKTSLLAEQADIIKSRLVLPVTCVGRIAGQYAKPRSNPRFCFLTSSLIRGRHCLSAAFHWVGERIRQLDGAHVEFLRGLRNPIGIKLSSEASPEELVAFLNRLCPDKTGENGRFTLITRLGALNVEAALPPLIKAVQASGHQPVWMCDPCHGNTFTTADGKIKTRCAMTIRQEAQQTYAVHRRSGSRLGGLHIEQTGKSVTECVEHIDAWTGQLSLGVNYRTLCDPRLSREQAILLVARFADDAKVFDLERNTHMAFEQGDELCGEKEIVDDTAVVDMPFVDDHPQELAAFAYQPPLMAGMACS
ncbi:MAG: hypothetical protein Q9178_003450 [Gyalolechia marmorata]